MKMTPIERAIAGEPSDRRRRWDQRMIDAGYKRVNLWVPEQHVPILKELKDQLSHASAEDFEALRDFVAFPYEGMLTDPECDDVDRLVARRALRDLGFSAATSEASEDGSPRSRSGDDGTA